MSNAGYNIEEAIELSEFSDLLTFICVFDADPALHYPISIHRVIMDVIDVLKPGQIAISFAEWLQTYKGKKRR